MKILGEIYCCGGTKMIFNLQRIFTIIIIDVGNIFYLYLFIFFFYLCFYILFFLARLDWSLIECSWINEKWKRAFVNCRKLRRENSREILWFLIGCLYIYVYICIDRSDVSEGKVYLSSSLSSLSMVMTERHQNI